MWDKAETSGQSSAIVTNDQVPTYQDCSRRVQWQQREHISGKADKFAVRNWLEAKAYRARQYIFKRTDDFITVEELFLGIDEQFETELKHF